LRSSNTVDFVYFIGQFWNIPVVASGPFEIESDEIEVPFIITIAHPLAPPRSFIADLFSHTWDRALKPCLYAGSSQGGPISTVSGFPNDPVIEGSYFEYEITDGIFGSSFKYNRLQNHTCPQ